MSWLTPATDPDSGVEIAPGVLVAEGVVLEEDITIFPYSIIGRPPKVAGIVPPKEYDPVTVIHHGTVIGANVVIYAGCRIGPNALIGDGVTIRENSIVGEGSVVGNNSTLQNGVIVGSRVRIVDLSHITAGVRIEDGVFWSVGVLSMNDNRDGGGLKAPRVGEDAFIGGGAILLPGVAIGAHAVVAAGAVVTKDVEEGIRVQGVPARRWYPRPVNEGHDLAYDGQPLTPPAAGKWDE